MFKLIKKIVILITGLAIVCLGVLFYLQSDLFYEHEKSLNSFDKSAWHTASTKSNGNTIDGIPRRRMVNDLLDNYIKLGMSRNEIEELIGKGEESYKENTEIIYYLGFPSYKFTFNTDVLKIIYKNNLCIELNVYSS